MNAYNFRGDNFVKIILTAFWKGVYAARKELASLGVHREANRMSQMLSPLQKCQKIYLMYAVPLIIKRYICIGSVKEI